MSGVYRERNLEMLNLLPTAREEDFLPRAGSAADFLTGITLITTCVIGHNKRPFLRHLVAAVAQLVEHRIVIPVVAGSSPVGRPNFKSFMASEYSGSGSTVLRFF